MSNNLLGIDPETMRQLDAMVRSAEIADEMGDQFLQDIKSKHDEQKERQQRERESLQIQKDDREDNKERILREKKSEITQNGIWWMTLVILVLSVLMFLASTIMILLQVRG